MGNAILMALGLTLLFNLVFFWVFHTYSNVLRFSSFADVLHISAALVSAFFACIIVTVISLYGFRFELADHGVLTIAYIVMFVLMALMRMTIKTVCRCTEAIELSPGGPVVAQNIPIGQWHTVRALESGTVIMEVKDGPYEPTGEEDILAL